MTQETKDEIIEKDETSRGAAAQFNVSHTSAQGLFFTDSKEATTNKFFHHPVVNCYYVFTETKNKMIFLTGNCAKTVSNFTVHFSPVHVELDTKNLARFMIHDRNSDKMELYVTENYGESFNKGIDYVRSFFWYYEEVF